MEDVPSIFEKFVEEVIFPIYLYIPTLVMLWGSMERMGKKQILTLNISV